MTRRPTIASINSSQGLSQQLSNLQIRRAFKRNALINGRKLNSTQKIVVNFLQQLVTEYAERVPVTEYAERVPATQLCTVASTTDYSVPTGYTAMNSCFNNWLQCTDRVPATQPCTVVFNNLLQTIECTDRVPATQPALNSLLHISRLQSLPPITNQHQESPTQRSSTIWPLLIRSLFIGLTLMTGLIMCSP